MRRRRRMKAKAGFSVRDERRRLLWTRMRSENPAFPHVAGRKWINRKNTP